MISLLALIATHVSFTMPHGILWDQILFKFTKKLFTQTLSNHINKGLTKFIPKPNDLELITS
jgi:hypothetical protein